MLADVINYSCIHAKVKALEGKLLKASDYTKLASQVSVYELCHNLMKLPEYTQALKGITESDMHRDIIERRLNSTLYTDLFKLSRYISDDNERKYLSIYFKKHEISILRMLLRLLYDERSTQYRQQLIAPYISTKHLSFDLERLLSTTTLEDFINALQGTAYYGVLNNIFTTNETPNLFALEMNLDSYYFYALWNYQNKWLSKRVLELQKKITGSNIDMNNIMWIYRARVMFNMDANILLNYLLPITYKLNTKKLTELAGMSLPADIYNMLMGTPYRNVFKKLNDIGLEKCYLLEMVRLHNNMRKRAPFSLAAVMSYDYMKQLEIRNIVTIIESVRYNVEADNIYKRLVLPEILSRELGGGTS